MRCKGLLPTLAIAALMTACTQLPRTTAPPTELFHDAWFSPPRQSISTAEVFAVSPAMRQFLDQQSRRLREHGRQLGLVDALLDERSRLRIEYDAEMTRTATQAFDARAGNCLSLVILTAAFAKELGLPVTFQQVETGGVWSRSGTLLLDIAHVNVTIAPPVVQTLSVFLPARAITIDFLPIPQRARSWTIDEDRVVAMFMLNRAVEHITAGLEDDAYWWLRAAILADPAYLDAINALGVLYLRHGRPAAAQAALRHVLREAPTHRHALGNLALVLDRLGQPEEAAALRAELRRLEPVAPLRDYDEGLRAMDAGHYETARRLFERELRHATQFHELHLNLARVYWQLKDYTRVREQLELARETSTTRAQQALYGAKLEWLKERLDRPGATRRN